MIVMPGNWSKATIHYISLFSGIGSCALASRDLGWRPVAFAEVDPFASAVLEHRFPNVPNVGDVTAYDWSRFRRQVDLVCGGPPCQPFSVAGDRGSLDDARGNLSLEYINAIDAIDPRFSLTENVPGWLSTKDNAFGVFLGKLVGSDSPLVPGRGQRWTNAGVVAGPKRLAAWRILDAQHYGVPQRRRRVFVLTVRIGDRFSPEQILFESESLPGNTPPLRGSSENIAGTLGGGTSGGGPRSDTDRMTFIPMTAGCLQERDYKGTDSDTKPGHLIVEATSFKASIEGEADSCDNDRHEAASTCASLLLELRSAVGEKAFAVWGSRVALSLQQAEVLRLGVHGGASSSEPADGGHGRDVPAAGAGADGAWALLDLRSREERGRPSRRRESAEQLIGELKAALSKLPSSGAQAEGILHGMWCASEGIGLLREALLSLQAVGQSDDQGAPFAHEVRTEASDGRRLAPWSPELADPITAHEARTYTHEGKNNFRTRNVVAFAQNQRGEVRESDVGVPGVRRTGEREEPLRAPLHAGQAGPALDQRRNGVSQMQVRRLTPL